MNPLVFDINALNEGDFKHYSQEGAAPYHLGLRVIGIPEGAPITVEADISHQGVVFNVHLSLSATLAAQCAQCGEDFSEDYELELDQFVLASADAEGTEDLSEDDLPVVTDDGYIDMTQPVVDEMGTTLPFAPHCGCEPQVSDTESAPDPRWAGLEKFL
ncbi:MAG: YceD family protein [Corynebacterium sp.]|nr:YceD family protein [Corynebacterium sp.]